MLISTADLAILLTEADIAAARLRRRFRLPAAELDDLRQELLLDLIRRLSAFDPDRGTLGAFANIVLRHYAAMIAARLVRERRAFGGPLLSLNAIDNNGHTLADRLTDADGLGAWHLGPSAQHLERRIDVARGLDELDTPDRTLCVAVSRWSIHELAARGFGSRATLYRRLRALGFVLSAHGLRAA